MANNIKANQVDFRKIIAEVWMSIIHGSKGIVYFIHGKTSFSDFDSQALLRTENADRLSAITLLNHQIHQLAPVIYQANSNNIIHIEDIQGISLVDYIVKIYEGSTYIFSVGMQDEQTTKRFTLKSYMDGIVEVLGEDRQLTLMDSQFEDTFNGYQAHLYKIDSVELLGDLELSNGEE